MNYERHTSHSLLGLDRMVDSSLRLVSLDDSTMKRKKHTHRTIFAIVNDLDKFPEGSEAHKAVLKELDDYWKAVTEPKDGSW